MSNATTAALKPASVPAVQPLLVALFKATPAYLFATAVMAAFQKPAQR